MENLRLGRVTVPKAHSEGVMGIQNIKEAELSLGHLTLILATTSNPDIGFGWETHWEFLTLLG